MGDSHEPSSNVETSNSQNVQNKMCNRKINLLRIASIDLRRLRIYALEG